jgi:hypothetical protein
MIATDEYLCEKCQSVFELRRDCRRAARPLLRGCGCAYDSVQPVPIPASNPRSSANWKPTRQWEAQWHSPKTVFE